MRPRLAQKGLGVDGANGVVDCVYPEERVSGRESCRSFTAVLPDGLLPGFIRGDAQGD